MGKRTFVLLILAVALVGAACGGDSPETETPGASGSEGGTQTTIGSDAANDHGSQDVSGMDEVALELDDFYFEPTLLTGSAGQQLTIELGNEGTVEHNFSLDEQSISQDIEPGEDASVSVTFPDSGVLVFYCEYHRDQGMVGGVEVA
jgi:plastocyanin